MPNAEEILGAIAEYVGEDPIKARELALDLQKTEATKAVAQVLIKRGIGKRTGEAAGKVADLELRLTQLTEEIDEKNTEIEQLRGKEPDYKRRIEDQERRHREKLEAAAVALSAEKLARREDQLNIHRKQFEAELGFGKPGGVEEDWGKEVLPLRYADRFSYDEDGKLKVLEPGETTAYDPADGDPVKQLAQDVLGKVPSKYRIMGQPAPGGGTQNGRAGEPRIKTDEQVRDALRTKVGYASP